MPGGNGIQTLELNSKGGNDYVVGDVHGCIGAFENVLKRLGPNDRLFLVGDLIDRGVDSPGIIRLIQQRNREVPGSVFAVKGNHFHSKLGKTILGYVNFVLRIPHVCYCIISNKVIKR